MSKLSNCRLESKWSSLGKVGDAAFAWRSVRRWGAALCLLTCGIIAVGCGDDDGDPAHDTTAPTTTASPAGGSYATEQSVVLTCDDGTGSGCSATYYTTDGSNPTTASTVYTSAIAVSADLTLNYFSVDNEGNAEAVQTETYVIDSGGPAAPVITSPTNGSVTNNTQPVVSGTAEAGSTVELFDTDGVTS